jgi:hypothetical protein
VERRRQGRAMSAAPDFVPVIDDAALAGFAPEGAPIHVPLVLARHVVELPPAQGMTWEMVEGLRRCVEAARRVRRASLVWAPGQVEAGTARAGAVELHFDEGTMLVWGQAGPGRAEARSVLLDANAALLFQGTLNFFMHFLNPLVAGRVRQAAYLERGDVLVPEIVNRDLIAAVDWARGELEAGRDEIELFALPLADRYGRRTTLWAVWGVEQGCISWQWEFDGVLSGAYLDVERAAWVSGFMTLVRMAYPGDWAWMAGENGDGRS